MTYYAHSNWLVVIDDEMFAFTTKQLAMDIAGRVNAEGKRLAYVKEIKVYGGQAE